MYPLADLPTEKLTSEVMTHSCLIILVIIDSDGSSCQEANFAISSTSTTTTRSWTIRVTQYDCGQEDNAGPPGCLQYYTETANTIERYECVK